jgi:hypothetical protein
MAGAGAGSYTEKDIQKFVTASREGRLSTRDRNFINGFAMTPAEQQRDLLAHLSDSSMLELATEIKNTKSPSVKKILTEHQSNLQAVIKSNAAVNEAMMPPVDAPSIMDKIQSFLTNLLGNGTK